MSESLPFSEVAQIVRGVSFDKNEAQSNPKAGYVPIIRAGNIQEFLNTTTDLVWVPETCVSEGQLLRRGDIAIAVSSGSASLVGKTAPLEQDWYGSVGAFCAIIRPKLGVSSTYLSQWFRSAAFDSWRTSKTRGANIQNLQIADLAEARIALPTLEVQVQRAACVAEQMAYSRAARMAVEDQAALAALFLKAELGRAFGGGVPVLASVQLGKAPSGWSWHRIGSWARLESGHTPSRRLFAR